MTLTLRRDDATHRGGTSMARIRNGNRPGPVAVRKPATKKTMPVANSSAAQPGPHAMQGVVEFPKQSPVEEVISKRIFFEVGPTRFAIKWTAEIERLPPAGPVLVEQKKPRKPTRSSPVRR
jgi:hypothetical protein